MVYMNTKLMNVRNVRYYLTNAEIEVLETYAEKIAERIPTGSIVVELGSGYGPGSHCARDWKRALCFVNTNVFAATSEKSTYSCKPSTVLAKTSSTTLSTFPCRSWREHLGKYLQVRIHSIMLNIEGSRGVCIVRHACISFL